MQSVTVAAAVTTVIGDEQIILVNGLFRPAQFTELSDVVTYFNTAPRRQWVNLAEAARDITVGEAAELEARAQQLRAYGKSLTEPFRLGF